MRDKFEKFDKLYRIFYSKILDFRRIIQYVTPMYLASLNVNCSFIDFWFCKLNDVVYFVSYMYLVQMIFRCLRREIKPAKFAIGETINDVHSISQEFECVYVRV